MSLTEAGKLRRKNERPKKSGAALDLMGKAFVLLELLAEGADENRK